jgi:cytoskeleton protein RodZ
VPVTGIGEELKRERLRQGLTLDEIVQRTRISPRSLEAIEADAFDRLPGIVFARGFVRLYAVDLKLDPEGLVARLPRVDIDAAPLPNPPERPGRTQWDPRLTAALASVLWLVTATGAGLGGWYYFNHFGRHYITTVSAAPPPKTAVPLQRPAPSPVLIASAPTREDRPASDEVASNAAETPAPAGFDNSRPVQVILTAREAAWVQISADGRQAFVGTLHPNDQRAIAADAEVKIVTGNAGGLEISLNGKPLDPIGPRGKIRRVMLTAEGPQLVQQSPTASSPL